MSESKMSVLSRKDDQFDLTIEGHSQGKLFTFTCPDVPKWKVLGWDVEVQSSMTHTSEDIILAMEHRPIGSSMRIQLFDRHGRDLVHYIDYLELLGKVKKATPQ